MDQYLARQKPQERFFAAFVIASILFISVWFLSYHFLPEGFLRGQERLGSLVDEDSSTLLGEGMRIFVINLIPMLIILVFNRAIRINGFPLGYLVPFINITGYAVFLGTNSFARPLPGPMAPSFEVLTRSGPYEMIALLLMAVSTHSISVFEIKKLFRTNPEKVMPVPKLFTSVEQWIGIMLALALLLGAALWEAYMILRIG